MSKGNWLQYQNKPALFTDPIFSDGFDFGLNCNAGKVKERRRQDKL